MSYSLRMKDHVFVVRFLIAALFLSIAGLPVSLSQTAPSRYWVQFTDKNSTPYTINNPAAFLSQKSIDRRTNQGISIQVNDLPVDPAYIAAVVNIGVALLNKSRWFNAITVYTTDSSKLDSIISLPFVTRLDTVGKHKNPLLDNPQKAVPIDSKWKLESTSLNKVSLTAAGYTDYGSAYDQVAMLKGDIIHSQGYRGEGMTIAILDAGFKNANTNPAFDGVMADNRIIETWDFVSGNDSVYDNGPHGLWVFSIIAANIPGSLVGTAPKANYLLLRTEDTGSEYAIEEDNWVAGAEFADSAGADILSTSLGYTVFNDSIQDHTYLDMDGNTTRISIGSDIAASKGMLVVTAAGNKGSSSWNYIVAPADADSVLSIGAVDVNRNYASFSSVGPTSDGRVKPNVSSMGAGAVTITDAGGLQSGSGTSFAAPLISGMAACLWQANPTATSMEVLKAIEESSSQFSNPDNQLGYGIPNFSLANLLLSGLNVESDTDNDGIPDLVDYCPGTPYPAVVDAYGCPIKFTVDNFVNLLPNPLAGNSSFVYYAEITEAIVLELIDMGGKKVHVQEIALTGKSYNVINLSIPNLSQGLYVIVVSSALNSSRRKIFRQ